MRVASVARTDLAEQYNLDLSIKLFFCIGLYRNLAYALSENFDF
jgi:hypothetical protein